MHAKHSQIVYKKKHEHSLFIRLISKHDYDKAKSDFKIKKIVVRKNLRNKKRNTRKTTQEISILKKNHKFKKSETKLEQIGKKM